MNWMNIEELNIFVIIMLIMFSIMLSIIVTAFSNQLDEHKVSIRELKKEVNELKNHIKE